MGNFYVNHTVRAPQDRVVAVLEAERRIAFVGPAQNGYTVVCDQECDSQDDRAIVALGRRLSARLDSPVLAVLNHDDDIFCYWLFERGQVLERFNSCPDYFDDDFGGLSLFDAEERQEAFAAPPAENAAAGVELCRAFGKPERQAEVQAILSDDDVLFALFTHQRLVQALHLPATAVATGYRSIAEGDAELDADECIHVGGKVSSPSGWIFDGEDE